MGRPCGARSRVDDGGLGTRIEESSEDLIGYVPGAEDVGFMMDET